MTDLFKSFFETEKGKKVYCSFQRAINDFSMREGINGGVVVGLSGGADSVMLLILLSKFSDENGKFPITALHINHMIRGDEADRDEAFSAALCRDLEIDFRSVHADIPELARAEKLGIEEAARNFRYDAFERIREELGYSVIAVAHNSTDNLETIIFNMMRGAGIAGLSGIAPVRGNIIRPLIYSSKNDIRDALSESAITFVVDSTNSSTEYTRNYIRQEIIPRLSVLNQNPEKMGLRISDNLRSYGEFIKSFVDDFFIANSVDEKISVAALSNLGKSVFFRILSEMMRRYSASQGALESYTPESTHVDAIYKKLQGGDFSYYLPGNMIFVSVRGKCFIKAINCEAEKAKIDYTPLNVGVNPISGFDSVIIVANKADFESYSNIYKIEIQAQIPSDIIEGGLFLREKQDGDSYVYGGMTRKLKKLFCDKKIPSELRSLIPIICDGKGILWVPGFGVRDHGKCADGKTYIALAHPLASSSKKDNFFYLK